MLLIFVNGKMFPNLYLLSNQFYQHSINISVTVYHFQSCSKLKFKKYANFICRYCFNSLQLNFSDFSIIALGHVSLAKKKKHSTQDIICRKGKGANFLLLYVFIANYYQTYILKFGKSLLSDFRDIRG